MIGSISKVRPCAHSHYYKYAHATNHDGLLHVERNIKHDIDSEGTFEFSLNNLEVLNKTSIFYNTKMVTIRCHTPNLKQINYPFGTWGYNSCQKLSINWDKVTNCTNCCRGSALKEFPDNFTPATTDFSGFFCAGFYNLIANNNYTIPYNETLNNATNLNSAFEGTVGDAGICIDQQYTFENLVKGGRAFYNTWGYGTAGVVDKLSDNLDFKNLVSADAMFFGSVTLTTIKSKSGFPKLETAGNMFNVAPIIRFCPNTDFGLPSLKDAPTMFGASKLDKDSTVRILSSLPKYESGTHRLGIGISNDLRYDEDVARLLKECDNAYVPYLESLGILDTSQITTNKGWTLTVAFRGSSSYDEVLNPIEIEPQLEMDLSLPDGYTRLRYLESDGTQYINTNYIASNTTGLWSILKISLEAPNKYIVFAGSWNNADNSRVFLPHHKTKDSEIFYGYGSVIRSSVWNGNYMHMEARLNWLDSKEMMVKWNTGTTYTKPLSTIQVAPTVPLYIFGVNKNNSLMTGVNNYENGIGRLYRFKISEGTDIIRDFIPALDSENKPCLYDIIGDKAYYNQGSGEDFSYNLA